MKCRCNQYHKQTDYILSETGTRAREQDMTEYSNQFQTVMPHVKQMPMPSKLMHKFHCTDYGRCDRTNNFTL